MSTPHPLEKPGVFGLYVAALLTGEGEIRAARTVGMSRKAVALWLRDHPLEAEAAAEAQAEATEMVEKVLFEAAVAGQPWAVIRWLKFRAPEKWGERPAGGALVVTPEALRELLAMTASASATAGSPSTASTSAPDLAAAWGRGPAALGAGAAPGGAGVSPAGSEDEPAEETGGAEGEEEGQAAPSEGGAP